MRAVTNTPGRIKYDIQTISHFIFHHGALHELPRMTFDWTQGALAEGLRDYNAGNFFTAHEAWESVWLASPEPEKTFLQGLIQVAAAFHHYSRANLEGTRNLLQAGLMKLDCFPEVHGGLEIDALRRAVRGWLAFLDAGEITASRKPPRIGRCQVK